MSHLPNVGRKQWSTRGYIAFLFFMLVALGSTMVVPFLITISGSACNDYDYQRFSPVPRYLFSTEDRFMKGIVKYYNAYRNWPDQMRATFREFPSHWTSWVKIGEHPEATDPIAADYLARARADWERWKRIAADYSAFCDDYPLMDMNAAVETIEAVDFLRHHYEARLREQDPAGTDALSALERRGKALELLSDTWDIPFETFYNIDFGNVELRYPMGFQGWYPPAMDPKYVDFLRVKEAYKNHMFTPGVEDRWRAHATEEGLAGDNIFPVMDTHPETLRRAWREFKANAAPASRAVPFALRAVWYKFLTQSDEAQRLAGLAVTEAFTVETYNELAGTDYERILDTPFPIPEQFASGIQTIWTAFIRQRYPLRLTRIEVTPALLSRYHGFLEEEIKVLSVANELLGTEHDAWTDFALTEAPPAGFTEAEKNERSVWMNFVKTLDPGKRILDSSEAAYQRFLQKRYGSLAAVNQAYGWKLKTIEEAFPRLDIAYTVTFLQNETAFTLKPILANYRVIFDYLILNGRAVPVTLLLVGLAILMTLTINPMAAYALSRFNLPGRDKIILFMLATMAFPAMVSAIPAYLLMRDLNLLNTFAALVLPSAANGMAIFILKGFFDSLPQELFEAATIDGASEPQIFRIVAMPLVKPILAINCVNAFIHAYNGWQWALIICQDKDMWTLAVWMYQASQWWAHTPWVVSAGFAITSIPTMIVFISCQKIILRGIVIPSMK